jgi:hypothetical protein
LLAPLLGHHCMPGTAPIVPCNLDFLAKVGLNESIKRPMFEVNKIILVV